MDSDEFTVHHFRVYILKPTTVIYLTVTDSNLFTDRFLTVLSYHMHVFDFMCKVLEGS